MDQYALGRARAGVDPADARFLSNLAGQNLTPNVRITIGANQNNYDLPVTRVVEVTATGASRNFSGFMNPQTEHPVILYNVGTQNFTITNQDVASTDRYRVITPTGGTYTVAPGQTAVILYFESTARWGLLYGSGT